LLRPASDRKEEEKKRRREEEKKREIERWQRNRRRFGGRGAR
jgi:hypothetical protein